MSESKRLGDLNGRWTGLIKFSTLCVSVGAPILTLLGCELAKTMRDFDQRIAVIESWKETIVPERTRLQEGVQADIRELRGQIERLNEKVDTLLMRANN